MMDNILIVAKKEFSNLMSSSFVVIFLAVFTFILFISLYHLHDMSTDKDMVFNYSLMGFLSSQLYVLAKYGSMVGIAIGFLVIYIEKQKGAINTLLVKPLYRDDIINGKLLGATVFILCVLLFSSVIYTAGLLLLFGNFLGPLVFDYLIRLPIVLFIALLFVLIFFSFSLLVSLVIKNDAFALFFTILSWILIIYVFPNVAFSSNLSLVLSGGYSISQYNLEALIVSISPITTIIKIGAECPDVLNVFSSNWSDLVILFLYLLITCILSYIVFIRRDVA
jgi:ABC-2 type transport system permease protein